MGFLVEDDYAVQIRTEIKAVINQTDGSQAIAEQMAEAEMTSYLKPRGYNIPAIFSAVGTARNSLIIMYLIDMVLYHLHSNIVGRAMPKTREDRYNAAISWLNKVSKGELDPDLPILDDGTPTPTFRFGCNPKYSKRY